MAIKNNDSPKEQKETDSGSEMESKGEEFGRGIFRFFRGFRRGAKEEWNTGRHGPEQSDSDGEEPRTREFRRKIREFTSPVRVTMRTILTPLGVIVPIAGAILGAACLYLAAWAIGFTGNAFLVEFGDFIQSNIMLFMAVFLALGIAKFAYRLIPWLLWPVHAVSSVVWTAGVLWIFKKIFTMLPAYTRNVSYYAVADAIHSFAPIAYVFALALGLVVGFLRMWRRMSRGAYWDDEDF